MQKLLPLWLFLLCLLLGGLLMVLFGWFLTKAIYGQTRYVRLGHAAVAVASFPDLARSSLKAVRADPDVGFRVPRTGAHLSELHPIRTRPGIRIQGLMVRDDPAALARTPAWRVVVGGFMLDGKIENAALLLSPELEVVNVWKLVEKDIPGQKPQPPLHKFVHGFAMLRDASMIFAFDSGVSLQRFDVCGRRIWAVPGPFGHTVSPDDTGQFVWVIRHSGEVEEVVKVATADGAIVRRISMADIAAANPTIDILEIRQEDASRGNDNPRNISDKWLQEPFHLNDVEPLPAAMAQAFPGFQAGDLLISVRSLNLIFVVDPQTLEVRWWHSGSWRRQHDPDWQPTGEITLFDNRMNRDYSRIVSIVPSSREVKVLFDGRANDFYSRIRGKHQLTGAGTLLVTSPQQGRVFEVEPDGQGVFEMLNTRPGGGEFNYPLSEAIWFPSDAPQFEAGGQCRDPLLSRAFLH
jgi:hypothetical protein